MKIEMVKQIYINILYFYSRKTENFADDIIISISFASWKDDTRRKWNRGPRESREEKYNIEEEWG